MSAPVSPSVHVRAIYGRPQLSKTDTNNSYRWIQGNCEGSPACFMANNKIYTHLGHQDMRASQDAVGTGVGKDWGCFKTMTPCSSKR